MLARFAQGGREPLVLGDGLGELALGLEDPLLEGAHPLGCVLEPAAEHHHLFLERLQLALEVADLALVLGQTPVVLGSHCLTSWIEACRGPRVGHYTGISARSRAILSSTILDSTSRDFPCFGLRNPRGAN